MSRFYVPTETTKRPFGLLFRKFHQVMLGRYSCKRVIFGYFITTLYPPWKMNIFRGLPISGAKLFVSGRVSPEYHRSLFPGFQVPNWKVRDSPITEKSVHPGKINKSNLRMLKFGSDHFLDFNWGDFQVPAVSIFRGGKIVILASRTGRAEGGF